MELRNKKTGEIRKCRIFNGHFQMWVEVLNDWVDYDDIDYLAKYWERYEEPEEYWHIDTHGEIYKIFVHNSHIYSEKFIGNYFETKEEAEEAVEKLKAWKRLKDKGFKFEGWDNDQSRTLGDFVMYASIKCLDDIIDDLNFLFGGEE